MSNRQACDICICIDRDGNYAVGADADQAREAFENEVGGDLPRVVRSMVLNVPLPAEVIDGGAFDVAEEPTPEAVTA